MCLNHRISCDELNKEEILKSYDINYSEYIALTNEVFNSDEISKDEK